MSSALHHPILRFTTAIFFAVSLIAQGLLTTEASAKMTAATYTMAMPSVDGPMDCDGQDDTSRGNCVATCSAIVGILTDALVLSLIPAPRGPAQRLIQSLSDLSVPPDPYPPRPSTLS